MLGIQQKVSHDVAFQLKYCSCIHEHVRVLIFCFPFFYKVKRKQLFFTSIITFCSSTTKATIIYLFIYLFIDQYLCTCNAIIYTGSNILHLCSYNIPVELLYIVFVCKLLSEPNYLLIGNKQPTLVLVRVPTPQRNP